MNQRPKYKIYSKGFKEEAVVLVTEQGYRVAEVGGVNPNCIVLMHAYDNFQNI